MTTKIIFHIDVNNAFLSWSAVKYLQSGQKLDIRTIPSIIGGDEKTRRGIVLAKSPIAKKYGIQTAETIYAAKRKCPTLLCNWIQKVDACYKTEVKRIVRGHTR